MKINKQNILYKTNNGKDIYKHVLSNHFNVDALLNNSFLEAINIRNPFTNNSPSLCIQNNNGVFNHYDTLSPEIDGDCFSLAELHYKLYGIELLIKINEDMNLGLESDSGSKPGVASKLPKFSFFHKPIYNKIPDHDADIIEIYNLIRSDKYKSVTETLRAMQDKETAKKSKAENFDFVTFSGTFKSRKKSGLILHSGYLVIDFDNINDVISLRKLLLNDKSITTVLIFVSPSGNGLKWVIEFDIDKYSHETYFDGVVEYFSKEYNIIVDKSGRDIPRTCFICHDKDAYINPKYI